MLNKDKRISDLKSWISEKGCTYGSTTPTDTGTERGLGGVAQAGCVARGDTLLSFPAAMLLDRCAAMRCSALGPLFASHSVDAHRPNDASTANEQPEKARKTGGDARADARHNVWNVKDSWAIIILLLHELAKGEESYWFPYIALLPNSFDNALHFTSDELALLEGTHLADELLPDVNSDLSLLGDMLERLRAANPTAFPASKCNAHTLRWAHSVFWSRALVVPLQSDGSPHAHNSALCPYLDLLNHCPRSPHRLSGECCEGMVALIAGGNVAANSEVMINYGRKSNEQLLLYYGFGVEENAADTCVLPLTPPSPAHPKRHKHTHTKIRLWKGGLTAAALDAARHACRHTALGESHLHDNADATETGADATEPVVDVRAAAGDAMIEARVLSNIYHVQDLSWSDPCVLVFADPDGGGGSGGGDDSVWMATLDLGCVAGCPTLERKALELLSTSICEERRQLSGRVSAIDAADKAAAHEAVSECSMSTLCASSTSVSVNPGEAMATRARTHTHMAPDACGARASERESNSRASVGNMTHTGISRTRLSYARIYVQGQLNVLDDAAGYVSRLLKLCRDTPGVLKPKGNEEKEEEEVEEDLIQT